MRALSIRQPWAGLIVLGIKDIENRGVRTSHRGELGIHASKTIDETAMIAVRRGRHPVTGQPLDLTEEQRIICSALGGLIGTANLTDCVSGHTSDWFQGRYGYVLADAKPMPFTPLRGMQGFFPVDPEVFNNG